MHFDSYLFTTRRREFIWLFLFHDNLCLFCNPLSAYDMFYCIYFLFSFGHCCLCHFKWYILVFVHVFYLFCCIHCSLQICFGSVTINQMYAQNQFPGVYSVKGMRVEKKKSSRIARKGSISILENITMPFWKNYLTNCFSFHRTS